MWQTLIAKLASALTIPVLNWLYDKISGLLGRWFKDRELVKALEAEMLKIKVNAEATVQKTNASNTKEELKRAAENTARDY